MKRFDRIRTAMAVVAALAAAVPLACGSSSSSNRSANDGGRSPDGTIDGGAPPDGAPIVASGGDDQSSDGSSDNTDGGFGEMDDSSTADAALGPHATVRILDVAKPTLTDFDFCFSTEGLSASTSWVGPMLLSTDDYLSYGRVSEYVYAPAASQSLRLVLRNSTDCGTTLEGIPDFALPKTLVDGSRTTLVFSGTGFDAGPKPLQIFSFDDAVVQADAGNSFRMVHVDETATGTVDLLGLNVYAQNSMCTPLFTNVAYGQFGTATSFPGDGGASDSKGYVPLDNVSLGTLAFKNMILLPHGHMCGADSGQLVGLYSTDNGLSQGAWTIYFYDGPGHLMCRDDGTDVGAICNAN